MTTETMLTLLTVMQQRLEHARARADWNGVTAVVQALEDFKVELWTTAP